MAMLSVSKFSLHCNLIRHNSVKLLTSNKFIGLSTIPNPKKLKYKVEENNFLKVLNYQGFHTSSLKCFQEDDKTKSLAVLDNLKQVSKSPTSALILGFAGLIPFVGAPAYIISTGAFLPCAAHAQLLYGAVILSFIGGVRWGLTLPHGSTQSPDWHNLGYSVIPSLVAWGALLASPTLGAATVIGGLGLTGYMDMAMWGYPNWYKGMRFCLTIVAILSLWTTFMCSLIMKTGSCEKEEQL